MANSFYGTGRRKTSVARVTLTHGTGKFTFNGKDIEQYFPSPSMKMTIEKPFKVVNLDSKYDVVANVSGRDYQLRRMQSHLEYHVHCWKLILT